MLAGNGIVNRSTGLATAGGFLALLLWSTTVALARSLSESVGAVTAATAVYGLGGILTLFRLATSPSSRQSIRTLPGAYLLVCGTLFVAYTVFLFPAIGLATTRQQVLEVGLLNYLWPTLTLLLTVGILHKRASPWLIPGTLLALTGISWVLIPAGESSILSLSTNLLGNPPAYGFAMLAAVSWALYSTLTRKWAGGQPGGAILIFTPATAVAMLLVGCLVDEPGTWNQRAGLEVVVLGTATVLAYGLWDHAMRKGNVVLVVAGSYLTPMFSTIISCGYLGIRPDPQLWWGCLVLMAGSFISWRSVRD